MILASHMDVYEQIVTKAGGDVTDARHDMDLWLQLFFMSPSAERWRRYAKARKHLAFLIWYLRNVRVMRRNYERKHAA